MKKKSDYHFELLDPLPENKCHSPFECHYPTIPHQDCGEDWIVIAQKMIMPGLSPSDSKEEEHYD